MMRIESRALTILVFNLLRALFPHFSLATIVDPLGRKAPGSRNLTGAAAAAVPSTKSAPFNKERFEVARDMFDVFVIITFGRADITNSRFAFMHKQFMDRLHRLPKLARETDLNRWTTQVCPKKFYEGRRVIMGENILGPYENRMGLLSDEENKPSAKDK